MILDLTISEIRDSGKYFLLATSIVGTFYYYKFRHTSLKYFLFLLWFITISEFFAWYISSNKINSLLFYNAENERFYNYWVYNLSETLTFLVYYFIYFSMINKTAYKKWIKGFAIAYVLFSLVNWIFIQNFMFEMQEYLFIFGAICLIICVLFYFVELLRSDKILVFHKKLLFWISIGLLLYYAGNIPFAAEWNGYALLPGIHDLYLIGNVLSFVMYFLFIFGFIWSKKE